MSSLLNIGLQALNVSQAALDTTGQNISNVNTPGYSRQDLILSSRKPPEYGVQLVDVARVTDNFVTRQLWRDTASFKGAESFEQYASRIDDLLAGESTSISAAMDLFFSSLQTAVDDPASLPARELFMAEAESLARRFNGMDSLFEQQINDIGGQIDAQAQQLDQILGRIASLNEKVTFATARQEPANELKDQRDELIRQVSELVGVSIQTSGDEGAINLFIGNGQPLVVDNVASNVRFVDGDPDPNDRQLVVEISGVPVNVSSEIRTGSIGGLLQLREQVLEPAWDEIGRLAAVFSDTMNQLHRNGMDLDQNLGSDLFVDLSESGVILGANSNRTNSGGLNQVTITDVSSLQASNYTLKFNENNNFLVIRESDGRRFNINEFTEVSAAAFDDTAMTYTQDLANGDLTFNIDGVTVSLNGNESYGKGEEYLIQPLRNAAQNMQLEVSSGRQLALASPIRVEGAEDNQGAALVQDLSITDVGAAFDNNGNLVQPLELVFNADGTFAVFELGSNPQVPYVLPGDTDHIATYNSGQTIQFDGYSVTLRGVPKPGDRFTIDFNNDGISDNSNALKMSDLQQTRVLDNASYQDLYGQLVESVGTRASVAQINLTASESVLATTTSVRDGVSGVNLDEEAANIIRFQQTYQAASQLIAASRTLFDTLLSVTGG